MFRRKPAPDLIRGGHRFADKNMRHPRIHNRNHIMIDTQHALALFDLITAHL
jgi:hypothetical protein